MKKVKEPTIELLLMVAGNYLSGIIGWADKCNYRAQHEHYVAAETLIEVVETLDCGSVGGFGDGQDKMANYSLFERWDYLVKKYWPKGLKAKGEGNGKAYFRYAELKDFFARPDEDEADEDDD